MTTNKEKFKNIEFLRFIFIVGIVSLHLIRRNMFKDSNLELFQHAYNSVLHGNKIVEFFFIMSGFFMFLHINKEQPVSEFIKKRLIRLWPTVALAYILLFILSQMHFMNSDVEKSLFSILFLNNLIVTPHNHILNVTWYVNILFWVSIFYFIIYKYYGEKFTSIALFVIVLLSYRILLKDNLNIASYNNQLILTGETLRGLGGMGIGYFLAIWYNQYGNKKQCNLPQKSKLFFTIIELCLIYFLTKEMFFAGYHPIKNTFLLIIAFIILFICFIKEKGYVSIFLERNWCVKLGKYSFAIYVTHQLINQLAEKYVFLQYPEIVNTYPILSTATIIGISVIFGISIYYFFEKPVQSYLKKL